VDTKTGVGVVDIYTGQSLANCTGGTPSGAPAFPNAVTEIVRNATRTAGFDSDNDGCTDQEENGTAVGLGGLRDPYNPGDFFDVPTGTFPNLVKDRAIAGTDFFALLGRFGTNDGLPPNPPAVPVNGIVRTSDPNDTPIAATGYHPAFDRGAGVPGGLTHQLTNPNGSIAGTDFFGVLGQFGNNCQALPNPPKQVNDNSSALGLGWRLP
jgi:hypothetical protein